MMTVWTASDWRRNVLWNPLLQCVTQFQENSAAGINKNKQTDNNLTFFLSLFPSLWKYNSTVSTLWDVYNRIFSSFSFFFNGGGGEEDVAQLVKLRTGTPLTHCLPRSTFNEDSLTVSVHPHVQSHAFTSIAHVKDPVVHVWVWWINIIIIIYPLTTRVVGAPQMSSQAVASIFPCSPQPSGTWQTQGLSIPWCYLPTSSSVCLVFFPLSLCLARWFWPDLMNRNHDHTTAVCVSLRWSGLCVFRLPAGSWHGLPRW